MTARYERLSSALRLASALIAILFCCLLSSCDHKTGSTPVSFGAGEPLQSNSGWLLPAGTYHVVTTRLSPVQDPSSSNQQILCTEPSPDWAVAFGAALQLSAEGKAPSGIDASLSGSQSYTESISALAGRTAGVVSLRDGLYAACQAYANHIIGKDAYGLIISQYGDLLVALAGTSGGGGAGASGISGAVTPTTPAAPAGVAVAVSTGATTSAGSAAAPSKSTTSETSPASQVALVQQETLQALLTVCLTNADPTEKSFEQQNPLLNNPTICGPLLRSVVAASGQLLKPLPASGGGTTNPPPSGGKGGAVADPAILALQIRLNKAGAGLVPDGIYGQKTKAAMLKYPNAV